MYSYYIIITLDDKSKNHILKTVNYLYHPETRSIVWKSFITEVHHASGTTLNEFNRAGSMGEWKIEPELLPGLLSEDAPLAQWFTRVSGASDWVKGFISPEEVLTHG